MSMSSSVSVSSDDVKGKRKSRDNVEKQEFARLLRLRLLDLEKKGGCSRMEAKAIVFGELCDSLSTTKNIDSQRVNTLMKKYSLSEQDAVRSLAIQLEFQVRHGWCSL